MRAAMDRWGEDDGSVPDPATDARCPDASVLLSALDGRCAFESAGNHAGDSPLTGCQWSTGVVAASAERVDVSLRALPELDAVLFAQELEQDAADEGCTHTTLFPALPAGNVLEVCERYRQELWTVTVLDEDGTGGWVVTAAVGTDVAAGQDLPAESIATLWHAALVLDSGKTLAPPPTGEDGRLADRWDDTLDQREADAEELLPLAEALRAGLEARGTASVPEPGQGVPCPDAAEALGVATGGYELAPAPPASSTSEGCTWSLATPPTSAWDSLDLTLRGDAGLTIDRLQREYNAATNDGGCYASAMPGSNGLSALLVCRGEAGTSWTLTVLADDGTGGWELTADVGADLPESTGTGSASVFGLRDVVLGL